MITRTKVNFKNVKMELLGQTRTVEDVNLIIETDTRTGKSYRILTFDELSRLEEREHIKIMKNRKKIISIIST